MKYAIFYKSKGKWIGPWGEALNTITDAVAASLDCKMRTKSRVQIRALKWKKVSKKKLRRSVGKVDVYCC